MLYPLFCIKCNTKAHSVFVHCNKFSCNTKKVSVEWKQAAKAWSFRIFFYCKKSTVPLKQATVKNIKSEVLCLKMHVIFGSFVFQQTNWVDFKCKMVQKNCLANISEAGHNSK